MKKLIVFLLLLFGVLSFLKAGPQLNEFLIAAKNSSFSAIFVQDGKIYVADSGKREIIYYDIESSTWQSLKIRLPAKSKIIDMFIQENEIYIWDTVAKSIIKYSLAESGNPEQISLRNSPALAMKGERKMAVNYQGFIYLLDSAKLICLSPEGMLIASRQIPGAVSMSIAEDQCLYVLSKNQKNKALFDINRYDLFLNDTNYAQKRIRNDYAKTQIIDLAVNPWGEIHTLITGNEIKLKKWTLKDGWDGNWELGRKQKSAAHNAFWGPTSLKCGYYGDTSLLVVLDAAQNAIHISKDESKSQTKLGKPSFTMRPSLEVANQANVLDYTSCTAGSFSIEANVKLANKKPDTFIVHKDLWGNLLYRISLSKSKKDEKQIGSFDALAQNAEYLYVLDKKSSKVHVFIKQDGSYLMSFGKRGKAGDMFQKPASIACTLDGIVCVADEANGRILLFDEVGDFIRRIDLTQKNAKPVLIRVSNKDLYCLLSGQGIVKIPDFDKYKQPLIVKNAKIESFELVGDIGIAALNAKNQELLIYDDIGVKYSFFSKGQGFPHFEQIYLLHYDATQNRLIVMDKKAPQARYLHLHPALGDVPLLKLRIVAEGHAELYWDKSIGIKKWELQVYQEDHFIKSVSVNEAQYRILDGSQTPLSYRVRAEGEDGRQSESSNKLADYYSYANHLMQNRRYQEAIEYYDKAYKVLPHEKILASKRLCHLYEYENYKNYGNFLNAHKELNKAWEILADLALVIKKCELYDLEGDYEGALSFLATKADRFRTENEIARYFIKFAYLNGHYNQASREGEEYLASYSHDIEITQIVAEAFKEQENKSKAIQWYEALLRLKPDFHTEINIVKLLLADNQRATAEKRLRGMLSAYSNNLDQVHYHLGTLYLDASRFGEAVFEYREAIRLNAQEPEYYFCLAVAYEKNNQYNEAENYLKEAYNKRPSEIKYALELAKFLKDRENNQALRIILESEKHLSALDDRGEFYKLKALLLYSLDKLDEADAAIALAKQHNPNDPEIDSIENSISIRSSLIFTDRAPLNVSLEAIQPIFPVLNMNYDWGHNFICKVELKNTRPVNIDNIIVKISIPGLGSDKTIVIPKISARQKHPEPIYFKFNNRIFDGGNSADLNLEISYSLDGKPYTNLIAHTLEIKRLGAMNWQNREMLASFVNPDEVQINQFIRRSVLTTFGGMSEGSFGKSIADAIKIYSYFRANNLSYTHDSISSDQQYSEYDDVQFPHITINNKSGDCEDLVVLFATCLGNVSVNCGFLDMGNHVILVFDSGIKTRDQLRKTGIAEDRFIAYDERFWVPLETTIVDSEDFVMAWTNAKGKYDNAVSAGRAPRLVIFTDAHDRYLRSTYSSQIDASQYANQELAKNYFQQDLNNLSSMAQYQRKAHYEETLRKHPDNISPRLEYADFLFKELKEKDAAIFQYQEVLKRESTNFNALLGLGHVHNDVQNIAGAKEMYLEALKYARNTEDKDTVNLSLCLLYYLDQQRAQALEYYSKLVDKERLKRYDPQIYYDINRE